MFLYRGNQAYADGDVYEAEKHYTRGVNSVPRDEESESCLAELALCYSNRAAARMACARMRAALKDCQNAINLNPYFRKVQLRAAK